VIRTDLNGFFMSSITHKVWQIQYWECLMMSLAIMPFWTIKNVLY
jgi:hypothetical protein